MNKQTQKHVISEEIAIEEIKSYLSNFEIELNNDEVKENYPKVLQSVMEGRLVFDSDLTPNYELLSPMNPDSIEFKVTHIKFKTRILPTTMASLARGLDLKKDAVNYSLVLISHIVGFSTITELDKLSKKDYSLIQELAPVFM